MPPGRDLRSRLGCERCRKAKKKCDEKKPRCRDCVSSGAKCLYLLPKKRQQPQPQTIILPRHDPGTTRLTAETSSSSLDETGTLRSGQNVAGIASSTQAGRVPNWPISYTPTTTYYSAGSSQYSSGLATAVPDHRYIVSPMQPLTRTSIQSMNSMNSMNSVDVDVDHDFGQMRVTSSNANILHMAPEPVSSPVSFSSDHNLIPRTSSTSFAGHMELPHMLPNNLQFPQVSLMLPYTSPQVTGCTQSQISHFDVGVALNGHALPGFSNYFMGQGEEAEHFLVRELETVTRTTRDERLIQVLRDYRGYTQTIGGEGELFLSTIPQRLEATLRGCDLSARARSLMLFGLAHLSFLYNDSPQNVLYLLECLQAHHVNNAQYYGDVDGQLSVWLQRFMCNHGRHCLNDYGVCICGAVL